MWVQAAMDMRASPSVHPVSCPGFSSLVTAGWGRVQGPAGQEGWAQESKAVWPSLAEEN